MPAKEANVLRKSVSEVRFTLEISVEGLSVIIDATEIGASK